MYLIDTTLRDGEQAPGVSYNTGQRLAIAEQLVRIGITEIEMRAPVLDPEGVAVWQQMQGKLSHVAWLAWCRARAEDLEAAYLAGARRVHIALPVSDVQLQTLGWDWSEAVARMATLVRDAARRFDYVGVGAQDASRTPLPRLVEYAQAMRAAGARRLRLADTLGLATPMTTRDLVQAMVKAVPDMEIEFHAHNDLGMATANARTALDSGAHCVSATVLGIGERCGNASLEQLVLGLFLAGLSRYDTAGIHRLCQLVAAAAGREIAPGQPVVGTDAVRHQSGIHVAGLLKNRDSYQPYDPALVGRSDGMELMLGALTGRHALRHFLAKWNVQVDETCLEHLLREVRSEVAKLGRSIDSAELLALYRKCMAA